VYHSLKKEWEDAGVIFKGMDDGLREHEDIVRQYFGTVVPYRDNLFAAVNTAVWSGGSFVYIPKGVKLDMPLQAYFRINAGGMGQFERTLIIVEEGAQIQYIEGCTAPTYAQDSFHSGVIEIIVKDRRALPLHHHPELVAQRLQPGDAARHRGAARHHGVGGRQPGQQADDEVPVVLPERRGRARRDPLDRVRRARASTRTRAEGGAQRAAHQQPHRQQVDLARLGALVVPRPAQGGDGRHHARSNVECDALLLDEEARTDTYPYIEINDEQAQIGHEATVSKIGDEQLFYLMSRGLSEDAAATMVVRGFIEPIAKELPLEYAVELNRLIELEMEGSVG
jgi:Fe-S cluster assembly protein SufB